GKHHRNRQRADQASLCELLFKRRHVSLAFRCAPSTLRLTSLRELRTPTPRSFRPLERHCTPSLFGLLDLRRSSRPVVQSSSRPGFGVKSSVEISTTGRLDDGRTGFDGVNRGAGTRWVILHGC